MSGLPSMGRVVSDLRQKTMGRVPLRYQFELIPERVGELVQRGGGGRVVCVRARGGAAGRSCRHHHKQNETKHKKTKKNPQRTCQPQQARPSQSCGKKAQSCLSPTRPAPSTPRAALLKSTK